MAKFYVTDEDRDWWAELYYWENDPCPDCDGTGMKVES